MVVEKLFTSLYRLALCFLHYRALCTAESPKLDSVDGNSLVSTFVGSGYRSSNEGDGVFASFNTPFALAIDYHETTLFVTEFSGGGCISKVNISNARKTIIAAGENYRTPITVVMLSFADFLWNEPRGICASSNNNIYVADHHRLSKITVAQTVLIAGTNGMS